MDRLAIVTWHDAWADQDNFTTAHGLAQTHEPMVVRTLGWIVTDDERGISIVNEKSVEDGVGIYRGRTFIPRAMVQKVEEYTLSKRRAREHGDKAKQSKGSDRQRQTAVEPCAGTVSSVCGAGTSRGEPEVRTGELAGSGGEN